MNTRQDEIDRRLDLHILQRLATASDPPSEWHRIRTGWQADETIERLSLRRLCAPAAIDDAENDYAVRSLADYLFEPAIMSRMNILQARDYFLAVKTIISFDQPDLSSLDRGPVLLETLHHHCIFSMLFVTVSSLAEACGFRKVILLHLREPLDVRLEVCRACAQSFLGMEAVAIRIVDDWRTRLRSEITDRSIVLYMGDMPANVFARSPRSRQARRDLAVFARPDITLRLRTVSAARVLARQLKASHLVLDFPQATAARLRFEPPQSALECPLPAWVFWPAIASLYRAEPEGATS